jgi:hypothetical protein
LNRRGAAGHDLTHDDPHFRTGQILPLDRTGDGLADMFDRLCHSDLK